MAHQDVTDTVQIQIDYVMENNNASNILHALYTGSVSLSDLDALNSAIAGWLSTSWAPLAASAWEATGITLTDLNSLAGKRKAYPLSPPVQGTDVAQPEPANVTLAIKADVGHRGRGVAGRVFWVGLSESQVQGNEVLDVTVTAIIAALTALDADIAALPPFTGLAVPHRLQNRPTPPNPATSERIVGFFATNNLVDTQKDRLPFHKKRKKKLPTAP